MADLKLHITRHLRSARQWLVRAEEDFGKNDNISGELNLLLAQAELQHLKEAKLKGGRTESLLFRQGVALFMAISLAGLSFGGAYLFLDKRQQAERIVSPAKQEQSLVYQAPKTASTQLEPQRQLPAAVPQEKSERPVQGTQVLSQSVSAAPPNNNSLVEREMEVSPTEMQKLVRAAGKTLRGQ